jgi:hypothetical protein
MIRFFFIIDDTIFFIIDDTIFFSLSTARVLRVAMIVIFRPGANLTITSYNASVVKMYNRLERFFSTFYFTLL